MNTMILEISFKLFNMSKGTTPVRSSPILFFRGCDLNGRRKLERIWHSEGA